jgi:hypothetical protein
VLLVSGILGLLRPPGHLSTTFAALRWSGPRRPQLPRDDG